VVTKAAQAHDDQPFRPPGFGLGRKVTTMGILDGKVAVIAGGTSGIGARTAELFAAEGATTVIAGRRAAEGKAQAAKLGPKAEFVRADVSVEADVAALITGAVERHGQLDCLMNCAGEGGSPGGIASVDLDRLQRTLAIHLGGTVAGMKYAAPVMAAQRSGSIINVASIGGHIAGWTFLDYSVAKAAIIQLTRCTAAELGQHGVRVNSISPGPVLTGIFGKGAGLDPARADQDATRLEPVFRARLEAYQPIGRAGTPADVAAVALWLASDASSFVTGQDLAVDGGILAGRPPPPRRLTSPPSPGPCSPPSAHLDRPTNGILPKTPLLAPVAARAVHRTHRMADVHRIARRSLSARPIWKIDTRFRAAQACQ
jgi:NAD(P)-dependent dehydrogenase (short-subunit alcohol dehydrogenase family)